MNRRQRAALVAILLAAVQTFLSGCEGIWEAGGAFLGYLLIWLVLIALIFWLKDKICPPAEEDGNAAR